MRVRSTPRLLSTLLACGTCLLPIRGATQAQMPCPRQLPVDEWTAAHWSFGDNLRDDSGHYSDGILGATCPNKPPEYDHSQFVSPPSSLYFENVLSSPGLPATDAHVEIPNTPAWRSRTALSIEAWVHPTRGPGENRLRIIVSRSLGNASQYPFGMRLDDDNHLRCFVNNEGTAVALCRSDAPVPYDAWSHVAMTYDGLEIRAYLDGRLAGLTVAPGAIQNTFGNFIIGAGKHLAAVEMPFKGYIDEVRISTIARSFAPCDVAPSPATPTSIEEGWENDVDLSRWLLFGRSVTPLLREGIGWHGTAGLALSGRDSCGTGLWNITPLRWRDGASLAMHFRTNVGGGPGHLGGQVELGLGSGWEEVGPCRCNRPKKELWLEVDLSDARIGLRNLSGWLSTGDYPAEQDSIWHQVAVTAVDSTQVQLWLDGELLTTAALPQPLPVPVHLYVSGYSPYATNVVDDVAYGTLLLAPIHLAYPATTIGGRASRRLTLRNPLGTPLRLGAIRIEGGPFALSAGFADSLLAGVTLAPFASVETPISFAPLEAGMHHALAHVQRFETGETMAVIDLQGRARVLEMSWVTAQLYPGRTIPENTSVIVQMEAPDSVGVDSLVLHSRPGGRSSYGTRRLELVSDDGVNSTFLGSTPVELAGPRGVEFYVTGHKGPASIGLGSAPAPLAFRVLVDNLELPIEMVPRAYRLISVPLELPNNTIVGVLQDDLGSQDDSRWRLFGYDGLAQSYVGVTGSALESLDLGRAYWLITKDPVQLDTQPTHGISTPSEAPFPIPLQPGWNLIASPFDFQVAWGTAFIDSGGNPLPVAGRVEPPVAWRPDIQGYRDSVETLVPFEGYWVDNIGNGPLLLVLPAIEAPADLSPARSRTRPDDPGRGWRMRIRAVSAGVADPCNEIGVSHVAAADWDLEDRSEPPPAPGRSLSLYFPHRDWRRGNGRLSADIRAPIASTQGQGPDEDRRAGGAFGQEWSFDVAKSFPDDGSIDLVTLEFAGVGTVPAEDRIVLVDRSIGRTIDLRAEVRHVFSLGRHEFVSHEGECRFVLVVGEAGFVEARVGRLQAAPATSFLYQNRPNPFNPVTAMRYDLARTSRVELGVFDARGRLVRELQGGILPAGRYEAYWDGTDETRERVASGVYYCRLRAQGFQQTRRLVVLK